MKLLSDVAKTPTQISEKCPPCMADGDPMSICAETMKPSEKYTWQLVRRLQMRNLHKQRRSGDSGGGKKKKCSPGLAPTDSDKFQQSAGVTICLILVVALSRVGPHHSPIIWQQNISRSSEQVQLATIHRVHTQTPMGEGVLKWLCSLPLKGQPIKMQPQPSYLPLQTAECSVEKQNKAGCQ